MKSKHSFIKRNSLSIVLLILMVAFLFGQCIMGFQVYNHELNDNGIKSVKLKEYLISGHFIQSTFENWESEFLQMAIYVILTIKLFQVGSAESKSPDLEEKVDKPLRVKKDSPWPVRKGGFWLIIYSHSLSLAFVILFILSFFMHLYGSMVYYNEEQAIRGLSPENWKTYLTSSQLWFESFQNWQSEFLAVASIVILSIWLRQKGSPESKPVDAPHSMTGN